MKRRGEMGMPVRIVVMLVAALAVVLIFLAVFIPAVGGAEEATGCDGALRAISSAISSAMGEQIC